MSKKQVGIALCLATSTAFSPVVASAATTPRDRKAYTRKVAIVLFDGVEVLDFAGPSEVFEAASRLAAFRGRPAFDLVTVAATDRAVVSQSFLEVLPKEVFSKASFPDVVVIPGGDTGILQQDPSFGAWFAQASGKAELLLTVCTGALVPARLGMLDGLEATTWYGAMDLLRKTAPHALVREGKRFVDNGRIVTTAGVSAGIDGSLHAVARLLGLAVAMRTARYMEYHWAPEAYLSRGYSYLNPSLDDAGRDLQRAELAEEEDHFAEAVAGYRGLVARDRHDAYAWLQLAGVLTKVGEPEAALEAASSAAQDPEIRPDALYRTACLLAMGGKKAEAILALQEAVRAGFRDRGALERDPDLDAVRGEEGFRALREKL